MKTKKKKKKMMMKKRKNIMMIFGDGYTDDDEIWKLKRWIGMKK
jgi:hypothetical protein